MTTFTQFGQQVKIRHDFSDQLMVRYTHDGEHYETWISGEEVLQRLKSAQRTQQLQEIVYKLNLSELKDAGNEYAQNLKKKTQRNLIDRLADEVQDTVGDNVIGNSLVDRIRGRQRDEDPYEAEKSKWRTHLQNPLFKAQVIELAWLDLRGSLPDEDGAEDHDDWV